jgi:hypothetical protein
LARDEALAAQQVFVLDIHCMTLGIWKQTWVWRSCSALTASITVTFRWSE